MTTGTLGHTDRVAKKKQKQQASLREQLTVPPGPVDLASYDTRAKPWFDGKKKKGKAALYAMGDELSDLQERLFAEGMTGGHRSVLLVLQGMDTSGKGGIVRHSLALVDPQGLHIKSFKAPTRAEKRHDFLWRIERELPEPGIIGVFDRSHYEDVLIAKVHEIVSADEIERRYDAINDFEKRLADEGTVDRQVHAAHLRGRQKERLLARLDKPDKLWKFNAGGRRRAAAVAGLPACLRDRDRADQHRARALAASSRATASGTATSPSPRSCKETLAAMDPQLARPRLRRRRAAAAAARRGTAGLRPGR